MGITLLHWRERARHCMRRLVCVVYVIPKELETRERHHLGGREWHTSPSDDECDFEAITADLRQADDLLPSYDAHVRGNSEHSGHIDAAGSSVLPSPPGRRLAMGYRSFLCSAAAAGGIGASIHHW